MNSELYVKELKEAYITYLNSFKGRQNLYSRAMSAIINTNSKTKKLCLTIIREIFEDQNNVCNVFLNDIEISNKLLELLKKVIKDEIEFDQFISEFFGLSKVFEFIYKISQLYYGKEDYWGECIHLFLFKKRFKNEYLNNNSFMIEKKNIKITYDNFIKNIKDKYINKNEFKDEFIKMFVDSKEETEQMITDIKEPEQTEENIDISNQKNGNNQSENDKTNENSINGNGLTTTESNFGNNNEISIENKKRNGKQNIIKNNSYESELHIRNNFEIKIQSKEENIENKHIDKHDESEVEIITKSNTVLNYLNNQFNYYKKKFFMPILNRTIKSKNDLKFNDVGYYNKDFFLPKYKLNDKILYELITYKLKLNAFMGDKNEYGYFCYNFENYDIEALYSTINPVYLYNYSKIKDFIDDYEKPDDFIEKLYTKSRAMTYEYYINVILFIEKYKVMPYPRIVFPLDTLKNLKTKFRNEIEIDGAFLVKEPFTIIDIDLPFVFQHFLSYTGSNKMINICNKDYDINGKSFEKDDLCLLEIKTRFPENDQKALNEKAFPNILNTMLDKILWE